MPRKAQRYTIFSPASRTIFVPVEAIDRSRTHASNHNPPTPVQLHDAPYILAAPEETELDPSGGLTSTGGPTLHPLKRADIGPFCLHVYAEEAIASKADL